jgi:hypothetical protein
VVNRLRALRLTSVLIGLLVALPLVRSNAITAAGSLQSPEQFIGFRVGADNKLVRWDKIVEYMKLAAATSDRVRFRELGPTTSGNRFVVLEISSADTLKNLDRYKELQRKLYFQGGPPSARDRDEIFRLGKAVVFITCSVHATEIGPSQMSLELVHRLATEDSPLVKKVLDNVIVVLVPSANPDGQILVTDWFNRNLGTPYESSPLPYLYHPYAGHDNNRDLYALTQKESQYTAQLAWHDWFPSIWLDQHQMGQTGARIFVMPATDPINPNVHPLIYRWNAILGQSQAAALEAAGKNGIIYNSTFTNFWQGAMAWTGWWHNQIGVLTEVASVRIAAPTDQQRPLPPGFSITPPALARGAVPAIPPGGRGAAPSASTSDDGPNLQNPVGSNSSVVSAIGSTIPMYSEIGILPPPSDITPRTEYPRPWLGGRWTLRDIVDYELITTMALLETSADRREALLRQIYEVNRQTVEEGRTGEISAIVVPIDNQHDPRESAHLVGRLDMAGVEVYRAESAFEVGGRRYGAGAFVIPMSQVFARYAKDLLEKQTYPEVRRGPNGAIEPPYDVTAWSLGMQFGVHVDFIRAPLPGSLRLARLEGVPKIGGRLAGNGTEFTFPYKGADTAIVINRLLKDGARVAMDGSSQVQVTNVSRDRIEGLAKDFGLSAIAASTAGLGVNPGAASKLLAIRTPRIALYSPWTGGSIDEGWTRWVLEQYEFSVTTVHNADLRTPGLRERFDAIVLPDQNPRDILEGFGAVTIRPEYRGGIGDVGVENLQQFVAAGGTLITLGAASDLAIERLPIPVRNLKRSLRRDEHFAPGAILRIQVDTSHPVGYGTAPDTFGFYNNSPFFSLVEGFTSQKTTVVARYPNQDVVASGWLKGEELMVGRAAVVSIEMNPGRVVLFGLRPQHRAQTHATFPMLFNAIYLATAGGLPGSD